jgi:catechol 2,3-dioxygenase-like lactoylglutathione lyase family enzyme
MKRFHIHVGVSDFTKSVEFYSTLFGQRPTKLKEDYAKWMLEDPRLNFAISTRVEGEKVDSDMSDADVFDARSKDATCCTPKEAKKTACCG